MTDATPKDTTTPKRKRGQEFPLPPINFSFEPPAAAVATASAEDGGNSPRTKVAHRFRGLALESGGGATTRFNMGGIVNSDDLDTDDSDLQAATRKRRRPDEVMTEADVHGSSQDEPQLQGNGPKADDSINTAITTTTAGAASDAPTPGVPSTLPFGATTRPESVPSYSFPSFGPLPDPKARVKKRSSTPPLRFRRPAALATGSEDDDDDEEDPVEIVDPVRAALTWHEDEITVYDPDDEDDDGTGINGIGFRPTAALANARAAKRRQQMAEYRRREESEARSRRNQRRRGGSKMAAASEKSPTRKVRFSEADSQSAKSQNAITTTG